MKLLPLVRKFLSFSLLFFFFSPIFGEGKKDPVKLWNEGKYKEAGEILLKEVLEQKKELENQKKVIEFYRKEVERLEKEKKEIGKGVNQATVNLEAERIFREGWEWQHKGIFDAIDEREKRKCLNKAIEIFRRIVVKYPEASRADDAQFRICRIYYAFLKEYGKAEIELRKFLSMYPNSEFINKAKEMLEKLK